MTTNKKLETGALEQGSLYLDESEPRLVRLSDPENFDGQYRVEITSPDGRWFEVWSMEYVESFAVENEKLQGDQFDGDMVRGVWDIHHPVNCPKCGRFMQPGFSDETGEVPGFGRPVLTCPGFACIGVLEPEKVRDKRLYIPYDEYISRIEDNA